MLSCNWSIDKLPGISLKEQDLLMMHGITTTQILLSKAATPQAKNSLASQIKVPVKYINKWSALADLARIPSVGCQYCGVILHCGIASVAQLAQTPLQKLYSRVSRLYVANTRQRELTPSVSVVRQWLREARLLS
ncbi:hypothetical protein Xen7305DRAFT_00006000 [Xenococcus sp. PCC 7305]|uniref:DUF4332 domain-containing protein n=1 Tax=Xenococcus sp. PCC 7305 TaxID=102125 RepID=UPI0002ACF35F|nr:DUF4332 domain-containing protein [Xenococcus sp. PCC 7305]ELS00899.1 hypothetical protein Xen7305DRAFT_00006000 [Xenococcus sp. PCC 7305]